MSNLAEQQKNKIEALEQEVKTLKNLVWMSIETDLYRHALDNALYLISMQVDIIYHVMSVDEMPEMVKSSLDTIERRVRQLLDMSVFKNKTLEEYPEIQVDEFLYAYIDRLKERRDFYSDLIWELDLSSHAAIKIEGKYLHYCMDLLIQNSAESMSHSQVKMLRISTSSSDRQLSIFISDTGSGIPATVRSMMFREPITQSKDKNHLGIGILLAKVLVEHFGGEIQLLNTDSEGTTFVLIFPVKSNVVE